MESGTFFSGSGSAALNEECIFCTYFFFWSKSKECFFYLARHNCEIH